jgi:hypothetical protein
VLVDKDRSVLESADAYNHPLGNGYAFQSDRWHSYSSGFMTVRLTEVVRQQHDKAFTVALNKIRKGKMEGADYIVKNVSDHPLKDGIWLYGKRKDVERENIRHISNQVNNYPRRSLNYSTPLEAAQLFLSEKVLGLNSLPNLSLEDVKLTPYLTNR